MAVHVLVFSVLSLNVVGLTLFWDIISFHQMLPDATRWAQGSMLLLNCSSAVRATLVLLGDAF